MPWRALEETHDMYTIGRILAATDGSAHGGNAIVTGAALARRAAVKFDVVRAVETSFLDQLRRLGEVEGPGIEKKLRERVLQETERQVARAEVPAAKIHVRFGLAAPTIIETAKRINAGLIVVGCHTESGIADLFAGSTAARVIRLAPCPVLVTDKPRKASYRRILAAIDLSGRSARVMDVAVGIAAAHKGEVTGLYVEEPLDAVLLELALHDEPVIHRGIRNQFRKAMSGLKKGSTVPMEGVMRSGHSGRVILEFAKEWDAHLVVIGTQGHGFFDRMLLGGTSLHVLRHGKRATMFVPRKAEGGR